MPFLGEKIQRIQENVLSSAYEIFLIELFETYRWPIQVFWRNVPFERDGWRRKRPAKESC